MKNSSKIYLADVIMKMVYLFIAILVISAILAKLAPCDPLAFPWHIVGFSCGLILFGLFMAYREHKIKKQEKEYLDNLLEKVEKELDIKLR
ncbi:MULTISPECIES: hypothetical protein [Pasteurellaceae]|uniref:hypothetical protein n=1 Tax=Pasteurellaceae TaxID=712 RepID=UPI00356AC7CA